MISEFRGEWACFSNFYRSQVVFDGETYQSVEHAFQAAKTLNPEERANIRKADTPAQAKKLGRLATMRPDWDDIKIGIMRDLLKQKFSRPMLAEKLKKSAPHELVEGNWWGDKFWGQSPVGYGENWLGKLLMEIRSEELAK